MGDHRRRDYQDDKANNPIEAGRKLITPPTLARYSLTTGACDRSCSTTSTPRLLSTWCMKVE
jgi:hypothetical protein